MKAIIFDLDGVLIDSMWVWDRLTYDYLTNLGYKAKRDISSELAEMSLSESPIYLKNKFNMKESEEEIIEGLYLTLKDYYENHIKLKSYSKEILKYLYEKDYLLTIGTATDYRLAKIILEKFDLYDYFLFIETEDKFKKNNIKFYKNIINNLKEDIDEIYLIDDSLYAIETANKANLKTIGVDDESNKSHRDQIIDKSDYFIYDLMEIKNIL